VFQFALRRIDRYPWRDFSFHVWVLRIARETLGEGDQAEEPDDLEDDAF
jgi:hypothetical protein